MAGWAGWEVGGVVGGFGEWGDIWAEEEGEGKRGRMVEVGIGDGATGIGKGRGSHF